MIGVCRSDMLLSTRGKDVISTDGEERHSLVESSVPEGEKFTFEALAQSAGGWQVCWPTSISQFPLASAVYLDLV